jgi:hypothetical protein
LTEHGLSETRHTLGADAALQIMREAWNNRFPIAIPFPSATTQKARPLARPGLLSTTKGEDQPRVRERIMKLSKVYSATCHHRYSSER